MHPQCSNCLLDFTENDEKTAFIKCLLSLIKTLFAFRAISVRKPKNIRAKK